MIWKAPIKIGLDLLEDKDTKELLMKWKKISYEWQNQMISGHIYISPDGISVLEVNDYVEMVVLQGSELGTTQELLTKCGEPENKRLARGGTIWSYGQKWSILEKGGKIKEVWISE